MRKEAVWIIIVLAATTLAGLLWIQGAWLRKAIRLNEQEFERKAREQLGAVCSTRDLVSFFGAGAERCEPVSPAPAAQRELLTRLRGPVDSVFRAAAINDPYEIGVFS